MGLHVIVTGNPFDGLQIIGPFKTHNDAVEYAGRIEDTDWWVVPLAVP